MPVNEGLGCSSNSKSSSGHGSAIRASRLPDFVIIGAQKAASTSLHAQLSTHPSIHLPPMEIPAFEDPEYGVSRLEPLGRLLSQAGNGQVVGIKRPDYLAHPDVAERLHRHIPDAWMIAVLRNPVERAVSAYYHYMREGHLPVRPLEKGLTDILEGDFSRRYPRAQEIINFGFYGRQVQQYQNLFGDQLLLLLQEEYLEQPSATLARVAALLDIDPDGFGDELPRAKTGLYSLPRLRYLAATRPFTRRFSHDRLRSRPRRGPIAKAVLTIDGRILRPFFPDGRPCLSSRLRKRLEDRYRSDIHLLESILQRPLSHWLDGG